MEINRLLSDELTYELMIRGASINGKVDDKRKLLRELMRTEQQTPQVNTIGEFKPLEELTTCSNKLDELLGYLQEFNFENANNEYQRIRSRLIHIDQRLKRIQTMESNLISKRDHLIGVCGELFDNLYEIVREPEPPLLVLDSADEPISGQPQNILPAASNNNTSNVEDAMQHSTRRVSFPEINSSDVITNRAVERLSERLHNMNFSHSHELSSSSPSTYFPVRKWNLNFNGESSVSAFIERVEELRVAREFQRINCYSQPLKCLPMMLWYGTDQ